jgi:hypothetical protein
MALILPYPTYAAFTSVTIHSADIHNTPHTGFMNNDVYLAGQVDGVASRVTVLENVPPPVPPTLIFTKSYNSGGQTITTNGTLVLSHGLGMMPKSISYYLFCTIADAGFSPGEYIDANNFTYSAGGGVTSGMSAILNTSTLTICYANIANVFIGIHKTGRYGANLTNSSWQLIINAFA